MQKILSVFGLVDKPLWQSLTVWGLVLYNLGDAMITGLCGAPELSFNGSLIASSAVCGFAQTAVQKVGVILTALGIRKAAK